MNLNLVFRVVGRVLQLVAATMVLPLLVALYYGEDPAPFLSSILIVLAGGFGLMAIPSTKGFYLREGFAAVGLIWLITTLAGSLPFWFCGQFPSFADSFFESASGFTTTGATALLDIESLPRGILFWRSFTHWLGGMGVLVLATAIIPSLGIRSHYLTQAESPGPIFRKLVPKQSQSSKILYTIYCVLTLSEVVCLRLVGMPLFDAFLHAFSSAGTGGFSNRNASVGAYNSAAIEMVIAFFLLLFSINFAAYFLILTRRFREAVAIDEVRFFLKMVLLGILVVTLDLTSVYDSIWTCLRHAVFQVISIISTTGFVTVDYVIWPEFSQFIIIFLMFCGGCSGSTSGSIKCSRVLILLRSIRREVRRIVHPKMVEVVKLDGRALEEDTVHSVVTFVGAYMLVTMTTSMVISLDDVSFAVSFSSALTCISNAGPGLELVGPSGNYADFSQLSKAFMSIAMIVGRLEIFPILVLFSRSTWRRV